MLSGNVFIAIVVQILSMAHGENERQTMKREAEPSGITL